MENLSDLHLSWGNISFTITLILAFLFLRSGTVKQLIDNLKQLGGSQETLLKVREKELEEKNKETARLELQILRLEGNLEDEKTENRKLRRYDDENRFELAEFRRKKQLGECDAD